MKTYFVETDKNTYEDVANVLGLMIEYARFLEKETGRSNFSFVTQLLEENNITVREEKLR